jgi:hypothetical protein
MISADPAQAPTASPRPPIMTRLLVFGCILVAHGCAPQGSAAFPAPWRKLGTVITTRGLTLSLDDSLPARPDSTYRVPVTELTGNDTAHVFYLPGGEGPERATVMLDRKGRVSTVFFSFRGPTSFRRAREAAESLLGKSDTKYFAGSLVWTDPRHGLRYELRTATRTYDTEGVLGIGPLDAPPLPEARWRACMEGVMGLCPMPREP